MQLQPYDDFEKSDEIESSEYVSGDEQLVSGNKQQQLSTGTGKKSHQLNNNRHSPEKPPIFDANMLTSAQAVKMGISFNMCIHEIDVIDLKNVHPLTKNYPFVAVACGKWNDTTSVCKISKTKFRILICSKLFIECLSNNVAVFGTLSCSVLYVFIDQQYGTIGVLDGIELEVPYKAERFTSRYRQFKECCYRIHCD
jgi:hypothetical protein